MYEMMNAYIIYTVDKYIYIYYMGSYIWQNSMVSFMDCFQLSQPKFIATETEVPRMIQDP